MKRPDIFRKRYIPSELVELANDEICYFDDNKMITRWKVLNPRHDFAGGVSLYLFDKGWKISRFYDINGEFVYYYCDIISTEHNPDNNSYVFTDLLADVVIKKDGFCSVYDLDELADAFLRGLITKEELDYSLRATNALLRAIDSGEVNRYIDLLMNYVK